MLGLPGLPERSGQANHGRAASGPGFCGGLRGCGARGAWLAGLPWGWLLAGLRLACGRPVLSQLPLFGNIFAYRLAYWLRELTRSQAGAEYGQNIVLVVREILG